MGVLLLVADGQELSTGPLEIGTWGIQATEGDCVLYRDHTIISTTPLASLAIPLALPWVGWIVLAARRSGRRQEDSRWMAQRWTHDPSPIHDRIRNVITAMYGDGGAVDAKLSAL